MLRLKKLSSTAPSILRSKYTSEPEFKLCSVILPKNPTYQWTSKRFLDFYQLGNKAAIEKERARLADEMNRGYFADIKEMKQHGGKIATANKIIVPAMAAVKFPALEVNFSDGSSLRLPITLDTMNVPRVSMLCLSFRANSQAMIDSWTVPFVDKFSNSNEIQLFEVSFIDSWLLTRSPLKKPLLRIMRKSNLRDRDDALQRKIAYSFGDHYYFRKELKILNLLTGYIFLLDKFGRIRWQGFGLATEEELSSLFSCTSHLLEEE